MQNPIRSQHSPIDLLICILLHNLYRINTKTIRILLISDPNNRLRSFENAIRLEIINKNITLTHQRFREDLIKRHNLLPMAGRMNKMMIGPVVILIFFSADLFFYCVHCCLFDIEMIFFIFCRA